MVDGKRTPGAVSTPFNGLLSQILLMPRPLWVSSVDSAAQKVVLLAKVKFFLLDKADLKLGAASCLLLKC